MIRDRDSKFTAAFDALLADAGLKVVTTGVRVPRKNAIMEGWIPTCRRELLEHRELRAGDTVTCLPGEGRCLGRVHDPHPRY